MTPSEALAQAAGELGAQAQRLRDAADAAVYDRRHRRDPTEVRALSVYEAELRAKAEGVELAVSKLRERSAALSASSEAA